MAKNEEDLVKPFKVRKRERPKEAILWNGYNFLEIKRFLEKLDPKGIHVGWDGGREIVVYFPRARETHVIKQGEIIIASGGPLQKPIGTYEEKTFWAQFVEAD